MAMELEGICLVTFEDTCLVIFQHPECPEQSNFSRMIINGIIKILFHEIDEENDKIALYKKISKIHITKFPILLNNDITCLALVPIVRFESDSDLNYNNKSFSSSNSQKLMPIQIFELEWLCQYHYEYFKTCSNISTKMNLINSFQTNLENENSFNEINELRKI